MSYNNGPKIVTDGLVLCLDANNVKSYPGSGTTWSDLGGSGLNGAMTNITYTYPYFGYNGASSQVNISNNALLQPGNGDWTMETWVSPSNIAATQVIFGKFSAGGAAANSSYSVRHNVSGYINAEFGDGTSTVVTSTQYFPKLNTWAHLTYVWTVTGTKALQTYINGSFTGSISHTKTSVLNTNTSLYVGSYNGGEYSQWFTGSIGLVKLYNRSLSGSEVLQNYNATKGRFSL